MLTAICKELNNHFCKEEDVLRGSYGIFNNSITPPVDLLDGQYFCIVGSTFNDGVHLFNNELTLKDEPEFNGAIWKMHVPQDVIELAERIAEWQKKNGDVNSVNMSPFKSENFHEYGYSKGNEGSSDSGAAVSWKQQFASELNAHRRAKGLYP